MRMRKTLCFLVFFTCLYTAQSQGLLWRITNDSNQTVSYLFGTIHIRDQRVFQLGDSVKQAILQCDALFGELDLSDKQAMRQIAPSIMVSRDSAFINQVSTADYELVKKYVNKHLGLYRLFLNKVKPLFISSLISDDLMKHEESKPLDFYLQKYASKKDKVVGGLETYQEQLEVLDLISIKEQSQALVDQVKNLEKEQVLTEQMIQLYLDEKIDSLYQLDSDTTLQKIEDELVYKRNATMSKRMYQRILNKQSTFYAVGAAHLGGPQGMIALLRSKGLKVEAVNRFPKK
jgi:uncharacterized protein YbaP (TraB family)